MRLVPNLLLVFAGMTATLAFAPWGYWWVLPLSLSILMWRWLAVTPRIAFVNGWFFGVGYFFVGLFWVHNSMSVYGGMPFSLAVVITLLFACVMAIYPGLAGWLANYLNKQESKITRLLSYIISLSAFEWLRGWFLSGFPWLAFGYSQIDSPLAGLAPVGGIYLVSLAVLVLAASLVIILRATSLKNKILPLVAVVLVFGFGYALEGKRWTQPRGDKQQVAMIQANIVQEKKWLADMLQPTINYYVEESEKIEKDSLIIWPESAIPAMKFEVDEALIEPLKEYLAQKNQTLITGVLTHTGLDIYHNSILSIQGRKEHLYHKRHLVPFGEYFPFAWLWKNAFTGLVTMGEDFSAGTEKKPLLPAGYGINAGPSICYEIIFPEEIRDALPEADVLINISNDGWFGTTNGPLQHFEIARMRALETGRYLLRATNTGITAVINPLGEIEASLPQFHQGVLITNYQPMQGQTPWLKWGKIPWILCLLLCLALVILTRKSR